MKRTRKKKAPRPARRSARRSAAANHRPTIHDVSVLAGVSRMTVSRVMRNPDAVLPETRARVTQAISDLGYVPDRAAGSLHTRRTGFIALMLPTLTNANFSAVAHGLTDALRVADYDLLIAYTDYSHAEEERQLRNLLARRPEAIVVTGPIHRREPARMLMAADVPVIEIADLPSRPIDHVVGFSNYQAGRTAARYLIEKGFKRIAAVASSTEGEVVDHRGEERVRGFEDELRLSGISTEFVLRHGKAPVSYSHGTAVAGILLERKPTVEGVFAVSDLSAVGLVMECARRGVRVPEDLSVIGFGDFEIGREINPRLTTIHVDFRALGQRTGQIILELLSGQNAKTPRIVDVGLKVLERASVAAAPDTAGTRRAAT
ncbi:MAG TPA: LacI family DNA-binding transcriptional regulator [Steroidobacteraceae bacterium]|nr:LacI family DNA-binding transcriptional regulator [Steroidobacteraceae bacterium]